MPSNLKKQSHSHVLLSRKHFIALRIDGWRPRLELHEKHERLVKWSLHFLTAVGIGLSFFTLPWTFNVPVAVGLVLVDKFLQSSIFTYTSMYVHPLGFDYEPEKWQAMAYQFWQDEKTGENRCNVVGLVFNDANFAVRFFDFLLSWNGGNREDKEDNIKLSFITDETHYFVLLFPNLGKRSVKRFFSRMRQSRHASEHAKEHVGLETFQLFRKSFDTMAGGYALGTFVEKQRQKEWFYLAPMVSIPGQEPRPLHSDHWIKKWHFKSKNRFELDENEWEHLLLRNV